MARPKKVVDEVEVSSKVSEIKHVSRVISTRNTGTSEDVAQVEQQLKSYFDAGWDLFDAVVLAHDPNTITVFYTLVR